MLYPPMAIFIFCYKFNHGYNCTQYCSELRMFQILLYMYHIMYLNYRNNKC